MRKSESKDNKVRGAADVTYLFLLFPSCEAHNAVGTVFSCLRRAVLYSRH